MPAVPPDPSLTALLRPRSVAVVGASRRPGSIGAAVLGNLMRGGFQGPVYPVNLRAGFVNSVRAWPELASLPEVPDLVLVAVPAPEVAEVIRQAAALGVPAACVLTAGFGEMGESGRARERELLEAARSGGLRLLGPNCLGLQNADPAISLDATFAQTLAPFGPVAFASQSGALGLAALDYAAELGLGFSSFLSLGNKADLNGNDLLTAFEADPHTRVVLFYLESLDQPARFRELATRISRQKPIALVKSGRSQGGARAAGSHTGALAGPDAAVEALCRQAGVIRAETLEELFDVAMVLANQPLPRGRRVAVVTNAGGPGILAADALEGAGLALAAFQPQTEEVLRRALRPEASVRNPVDALADVTPQAYGAALRAVLADPGVDAVVALYVPMATTHAPELAQILVEAVGSCSKTVVSCFLGTHGVPESLRSLHHGHVPSFRFPEGAARALARVVEYAQWREAPAEPPEPVLAPPAAALAALAAARARLGPAGGWLSGEESGALCRAWYLPRAPELRVAPSAAAAVAAAEQLGCPVVLKAERAGLLHKTEAGAVIIGLSRAAEVQAAAERLLRLEPEHLLVQRQLEGEEWLVGMVRDPAFGPLITVGAGGTRTELWRDVERRLAPLSPSDLAALVDRPRFGQTLAGWRGLPPGDRPALLGWIRQLAALACAHPDLAEVEANPVRVGALGQGASAVDVRARLSPATGVQG